MLSSCTLQVNISGNYSLWRGIHLTGSASKSVPLPEELRQYCRNYFPSKKNGFQILDTPDVFLSWVTGILHRTPVPAPELSAEEWDRVMAFLSPHGIIPYLSYLLSAMPPDCHPPSHIRKLFTIQYLRSSFHSTHALQQAEEICRTCEECGVQVLILKSPAIGQAYYPEPSLRTGSDIDILVAPEQYADCRELLCRSGYDLRYDTYRIMPRFYHHACYFPQGKNKQVIELHWRPLFLPGPGDRVNPADLIARSEKIQTSHGHIRMLDPADALMYTAIHMGLFHEPVLRLSWVCDIHLISEYITSHDLWPEVMERSVEWQGKNAVERSVGLARQWTGLTLPDAYVFSKWPEAGSDEGFAITHMERRRAGEELLLHQILAKMPTYPMKIRAMYHWAFRPDLVHDGRPGLRWWQYPVEYTRMFYSNYQQIRR